MLRNHDLRVLQLSLAAAVVGGAGYQIALAAVAFEQGGTAAVGLAFALQIIPIAIAAPFTAVLADRFPRRRVLIGIDVLRFACTGAVALAVANGGSLALVLLLGAPGAIASTAHRPATQALLPTLADEPAELTAANVVTNGIEYSGALIGPGIAGLMLALGGPGAAFGAGAVLFGISGLLVARLRRGHDAPPTPEVPESFRDTVLAGGRTVAGSSVLRVLVSVFGALALLSGLLDVFAVVVARSLLDLPSSGVGLMFGAVSVAGCWAPLSLPPSSVVGG